jgi:hypothetical protein
VRLLTCDSVLGFEEKMHTEGTEQASINTFLGLFLHSFKFVLFKLKFGGLTVQAMCLIALKGQCYCTQCTIYLTLGFLYESSFPWPVINLLAPFRMFSKIREDICSCHLKWVKILKSNSNSKQKGYIFFMYLYYVQSKA